ncbi:hypothetical protein Q9L42_020375 (plasmid) [Methylomarinum sp. Ch1-1]|uniref:Uncharacterized protein n=1 Tax=Methylomarinum roseum TaxID=3067653 RepID=A0AAU7P098_9GAMM|nr:hypothetical protein [Methylomarinum sp. Ch1-1]MDP4523269.1 hypothetical protein [Methylomarinum sp. Ch1-1]
MTKLPHQLQIDASSNNRLNAMLAILGWSDGTIHQVANAIGVEPDQLLHGKPTSFQTDSAYSLGWLSVRTCSREHAMLNCFPKQKGNLEYWLGAIAGTLHPTKQNETVMSEKAGDPIAPYDPPSRYLSFNPKLLSIERTNQSKVSLSYAGLEIGVFDDEATLSDDKADSDWQEFAKKLFERGDSKHQIKPVASTIKAVFGTREPLYYEIPEVLDAFKDSLVARNYLERVINRAAPDTFHWTDYVNAWNLKHKYQYQPLDLLNLEDALEDILSDDSLCLYECEIGIFSHEDTNTPFETIMVAIAADSPEMAGAHAEHYAEENIPVVTGEMFSAITSPSELPTEDFLSGFEMDSRLSA